MPIPAQSAKAPPKRDIKEVWIEYKKTRTEPLRNILMENYLHLVRYNAERIHVKLPDEVELDDLMSAGIFGLMDAIAASSSKPTAPRASAAPFSTSCARWTGSRAWFAPARTSLTAPPSNWK